MYILEPEPEMIDETASADQAKPVDTEFKLMSWPPIPNPNRNQPKKGVIYYILFISSRFYWKSHYI